MTNSKELYDIRLNCVYQDISLNGSENGSLRSVSVFVDAVVK